MGLNPELRTQNFPLGWDGFFGGGGVAQLGELRGDGVKEKTGDNHVAVLVYHTTALFPLLPSAAAPVPPALTWPGLKLLPLLPGWVLFLFALELEQKVRGRGGGEDTGKGHGRGG